MILIHNGLIASSLHRSDHRTAASQPHTAPSLPPPNVVATPESGACAAPVVNSTLPIATPLPDEKQEEALPRYKRDLVAKIKILRTELQTMQPQSGHCRLEVSRTEIFEVCCLLFVVVVVVVAVNDF